MWDYTLIGTSGNTSPWNDFLAQIRRVEIEQGVTSIGVCAFYACRLTSINLPEGITRIEWRVFQYCYRLTSITLPESLISIGHQAFHGCTSLASINLPESLTSIENEAFGNCSSLTSIINHKPVPVTINSDVFGGMNQSACTLYVPLGSAAAYQAAAVWQDFNIVEMPTSVEKIEHQLPPQPANYYTLTGLQLTQEPTSGIYIIKYGDGTARKVVK